MSVDITLVYAIIVFMVAVGYLKRALFHPVSELLDQRRDRLAGDAAATTKAQQDRDARNQDYESRIVAAKKAAWDRREAIRKEAATARAAALAAARDAGDREIAAARAQIKQDAEVARTALAQDAQMLGRQIADRILGRRAEAR